MYTSGQCILIETNAYQDGRPKAHLFVILFTACEDADVTIVVPISSIRPRVHYDATVILDKNDHDFIKHPSYADYRHALVVTKQRLDDDIASNRARRRSPPMRQELVQRIRHGLSISEFTPLLVQDTYWQLLTGQ